MQVTSKPRTFSYAKRIAMLFLSVAVWAQEPMPVQPIDLASHRIGKPGLIHSGTRFGFREQDYVGLKVIVDAQGNVESAHAVNGPREFFRQAEALEAKRNFKPFQKGGAPVRASFEDTVSILPPEQWTEPRVPFPDVRDWNTLRMTLDRENCQGPCFLYSVEVDGNGEVQFNGSMGMLTPGHHRSRISQQAVHELLASFRRADYFSLKDVYFYPITDAQRFTTSIKVDGQRKSVTDYVGLRAGLPEVVKELEEAFDKISGTEKWVKGNDFTLPSLLAERWNFRADTEENRTLFVNTMAYGPKQLTDFCLALPALPGTLLSSSLEGAVQGGRVLLVRRLIEKGADPRTSPNSIYKRALLIQAVGSGKAEMVQEILKFHPDVNAVDSTGETALRLLLNMSFRSSDTQAILALLIATGADVNAIGPNGTTPIFQACYHGAEIVRLLAKAGANLNARNWKDETPLMSCSDQGSLKAMIDAGADLTFRNRDGLTAAELARKEGLSQKAELLELAMRHKNRR